MARQAKPKLNDPLIEADARCVTKRDYKRNTNEVIAAGRSPSSREAVRQIISQQTAVFIAQGGRTHYA